METEVSTLYLSGVADSVLSLQLRGLTFESLARRRQLRLISFYTIALFTEQRLSRD